VKQEPWRVTAGIPGPAVSHQASDSAAVGWHDVQPDLHAEPYVFAAAQAPFGVSPFALILEDEGPTLILTRADADQSGLAHDHLFVPWDQRSQALTLLREL
jgi:hypothetical protein